MSDDVPPIRIPMALRSRRGKPGDTHFDIVDLRSWQWDETRQVWVTDGDEGGRAGKVIVTDGRRALEESKTIEGTATEGDETI